MEFRVIKEYAGIKVGTEVNIALPLQDYMLKSGYVERIDKPLQSKMVQVPLNKHDKGLVKRKNK